MALRAEISASAAGSSWLASGEFAFCHPEESAASMVMEISDEVWACQSCSPRELKIPSTDSEEEKMPAVVSLCRSATPTILLDSIGAQLGSEAGGLRKMPAGPGCRVVAGDSPAPGIGNKSGSGC